MGRIQLKLSHRVIDPFHDRLIGCWAWVSHEMRLATLHLSLAIHHRSLVTVFAVSVSDNSASRISRNRGKLERRTMAGFR